MNDLMETLLDLLDSPQADTKIQARASAREAVRAAEQRLTMDEFDDLWNAALEIFRTDDLNSFILGFRLGVQLTLEGLRPIVPK